MGKPCDRGHKALWCLQHPSGELLTALLSDYGEQRMGALIHLDHQGIERTEVGQGRIHRTGTLRHLDILIETKQHGPMVLVDG